MSIFTEQRTTVSKLRVSEMKRFEHTRRSADVYNAMIREWAGVSCDSDLERMGIEHKEYIYSGLFMDMLRFNGAGATEYENVAKWAERHGCIIRESEEGWLVNLPIE